MKDISILLLVLYALVSVSLAANDKTTENYDVVGQIVGEGLESGQRVKFYEIWQAHGNVEENLVGFSHYRVIVGDVTKKKLKDKSYSWDFEGTAYDMQTASEGVSTSGSPIIGQKIEIGVEEWKANHYWSIKDSVWVRVSKDNTYKLGGNASKSKNELVALSEGYQAKYGYYLLLVNDCQKFAEWLMNEA